MAGTYTYTFLAKDLMSSKLAQIGNKGKSTFTTINQKVDNMTVNIQRADRASQKINSTWNRTLGLATRLGLAFSFTSAATGVSRLGGEFEQMQVAFETMLGSAEKGDQLISSLFDFANKSPYNVRTVQRNAETLLGFGVANEKILPAMQMIGDVSRGNQERFNNMTLAYAQMQSAGKLMGQDLLQMINAGFNPLQYISEETGESMAVLRKKMEQGAISAAHVERAFARATGPGGKFFNLMNKQSQTFLGKLEILKGKTQIWAMSFGQKLLPYLSKFTDWGIAAVDFLPKIPAYVDAMYNSLMSKSTIFRFLVNNIEGIKTGVLALGAAWLTYKTYMTIVSTATKIYTGIQWLLNGAMLANPVGLIVAGIAALAAGFAYAYNRIGWFRGGINAAWEVLKGFGTAMKELVVDRFKEMLAGLSSLGEAFLHFFKGDWQKAWDAGKKGVQGLTGYGGDAIKNFQANARITGKKAAEAFGKGMDEAAANKKSGSIMDLIKNKVGLGSSAGTSDGATGSPAGTGPLGDSLKDGINAINGGGARQTNITVTFDKLVENFTISSQNIQQGMAQSEEELKRMLLRVLNSTNQMQTSPT